MKLPGQSSARISPMNTWGLGWTLSVHLFFCLASGALYFTYCLALRFLNLTTTTQLKRVSSLNTCHVPVLTAG
jgi:hypothetical protein